MLPNLAHHWPGVTDPEVGLSCSLISQLRPKGKAEGSR